MAITDHEPGAVVITGASTGIGRACALHLDRLGFRVFAGVRKAADGEALRAVASDRLAPLMIDVADGESIAAAAREVDGALGGDRLAGLVNNAGIVVAGPLELLPMEELRRQFDVNVLGQVAVTQAFLPRLRQAVGRVVLMGSISGRFSTPFTAPYCMSKFALEAMADALRVELRPWGLHVAIVEPGSIATPIWEKSHHWGESMHERLPAEGRKLYDAPIRKLLDESEKMGRRGISPDYVARAVAHALTAPRPRTRYPVGLDSRVMRVVAKWTPDRLRDWMVAKYFGLGKA